MTACVVTDIIPINLDKFLIDTLSLWRTIRHSLVIFCTFPSSKVKIMRVVSIVSPRYAITWVRDSCDFSQLILNPSNLRRSRTSCDSCSRFYLNSVINSMSSRKIMLCIPPCLRRAITGSSNFMKTHGVLLRPKGRQWNLYSCSCHMNRRYFWCPSSMVQRDKSPCNWWKPSSYSS